MKIVLAALAVAAPASPAFAQDAHAGHAGHSGHDMAAMNAAPAATARLNLDTPVEAILADPAGKAVMDANIPQLATHEHYNAFKQMGLRQLANYAPDQLPAELLAKVETELAAIK